MVDRESDTPASQALGFSPLTFLIRDWPYIAMLVLALFGVAYTSVSRHAMTTYWMILVPVFGVVCILIQWRETPRNALKWNTVKAEALHWGAVMLAMYLVFVADMEKAMSAEASALVVLVILALSTFTSGAYLSSWPISLVGVVLALGVPVFAWLEERTLVFALGGIAFLALVALVALSRRNALIHTDD